MKDIINEPFILTEYGQGYRRVFDKELAKHSLEITPVLEIGRTDIITSIVAQSNMISYLPDFVTKELIESGKLCYLDVKDMNIEIINNYSSKKHEEIILDENAKLILHYYSTSEAKEILESFKGYEGIGCIEIHNPLLDLIVSI